MTITHADPGDENDAPEVDRNVLTRLEVADLRRDLAQAQAALGAMRAALEQVEFINMPVAPGVMTRREACPWCDDTYPNHKPDCPRQLALSGDAGKLAARVLAAASLSLKAFDKLNSAIESPIRDMEVISKLREEYNAHGAAHVAAVRAMDGR